MNYNADTGKVTKGDRCAGDPKGAKVCPPQAIVYVDADWTGYERMKAWAVKTDTQPHA